jgi:hypothetical protein
MDSDVDKVDDILDLSILNDEIFKSQTSGF